MKGLSEPARTPRVTRHNLAHTPIALRRYLRAYPAPFSLSSERRQLGLENFASIIRFISFPMHTAFTLAISFKRDFQYGKTKQKSQKEEKKKDSRKIGAASKTPSRPCQHRSRTLSQSQKTKATHTKR